jgi:hypothetical protein
MSYEDLGAPQSRNEMYLMNMLGASYEPGEPQSRIEYLLKEILENGGGSGAVTGVKGAVEEEFRKGNVNLTIEEITNIVGGLTYDELTQELHDIQYESLPTPADKWIGRIVQYVGTDTTSLTSGHFFKCVNDSGTLKWNDISEKSLTDEQLNALLAILN